MRYAILACALLLGAPAAPSGLPACGDAGTPAIEPVGRRDYGKTLERLKPMLLGLARTDDRHYGMMERALEEYFKDRCDCWKEQLLVFLGDTSREEVDRHSLWKEKIKILRDRLQKRMEALEAEMKGVRPPHEDAVKFLTEAKVAEDKLLEGLEKSGVAMSRDAIIKNQKFVMGMELALTLKWALLYSDDQTIDEKEGSACGEIEKLVKEVFDLDEKNRAIKEKFLAYTAAILEFIGKGTALPLPEKMKIACEIGEVIGKTADLLHEKVKNAKKRFEDFDYLIRSEKGGIYVLFSRFREDTELFIKENGFDRAQACYEVSRKVFEDLASAQGANWGTKGDIEDFAKQALEKLSGHLTTTQTIHDDFVKKHKGKFFGALGPDIREALDEKKSWEDRQKSWEGLGLDGLLRRWREQADKFWYVDDVNKLSDEDRKILKENIQKQLDELFKAWAESERFFKNNYPEFLKARTKYGEEIK